MFFVGGVEQYWIGVFLCFNFLAGYFNVYCEVVENGEFDFVFYLGDYIYEYLADGYVFVKFVEFNCVFDLVYEIVEYVDYVVCYVQYKLDLDLQVLYGVVFWIMVWDDYEIVNDSYVIGVENYDVSEGDWYEWCDVVVWVWYDWILL